MPIASIICAAAVFVICAWYFERRHRALEVRMTAEVKERYAAYIDLEERVRVALGEFDCLESSFEIEVRKSRDQIKHLEQALNAVEGVESATVTVFHPHGRDPASELANGSIPIGAWEIARLDNDPSNMENGTLTVAAGGGS